MTETDFISTSHLQCDQLFEYHNKVRNFLPATLITASIKYIVHMITVRCLQISRMSSESILNVTNKIAVSAILIALNSKFGNGDWVDKLTSRHFKLIQKYETKNQEVKLKAIAGFRELFWNKNNVKHYKISSGHIPQMLEMKVSEWTVNLLKTTVVDKIKSQMPKQQEAPVAQPSGFVNMFVSYFTEQSPKENAQAVDHPHVVIVSEIVRKLGL